jgi:2-keto-4-pentenoate hydratase
VELDVLHNDVAVDVSAPAAGPLADVASMVRFTASGAVALGETLRPNDVILSGKLALAFVTPGDTMVLRSRTLGDLDLQLSSSPAAPS